MRLRHILFLIFGVMTALPLAFFWFWLERSMIDREVSDVSERHLLIARNLGAALERYQRDVKSGFELIAGNMMTGRPLAQTGQIMTDLGFTQILIVDKATGRLQQMQDAEGRQNSARPDLTTLFILADLATDKEVSFSPVEQGPDGRPVLYVVKSSGALLAVGVLRTDYFVSLGKSVAFGVKGHAAIVDHEGNVLAHPLDGWIEARKNISKVSAVQRMLRGEQGVETFWSPALKGDMIAGFTAVKGAGWGVMIPQPVAELHHRAQVARDSLFYVVAALLAAAVLFAAALTPLISGPLNQVIVAARRIRAGQLSARIEDTGSELVPHELRDLQQTFNAMATAVEMYQRKEEEKRVKAEQEARIRADYMANLTHELRTPLNAVIGFSEIMCKEQFGPLGEERYQDFVNDINTSASTLLRLVNDLLEYSRIDSGAYKLDEEHLPIARAVARFEADLRKQGEERDIRLEFALPADDLTLWADKTALDKMILALAAHAIRHTPDGGHVRIEALVPETGEPEIRISDNGQSMSQEDVQRAMQPQIGSAGLSARGRPGTGLGLALVSKLIERHDGTLLLHSEPGQGNIARLIFPRERLGQKAHIAA